jgi:ribosomal protein L37AE/L43A
MATDKPINQEEEYFLKADMEKINTLRGKLDQSRKEENEKQRMTTHWMKCPKCGSDLEEVNHQEVMIDQCGGCKGIWLDAGELELLTQGKAALTKGLLQKLFN